MISRLPLRWRLTLWYGGFLALALAIFAGAFYFGLQRLLYRSLDAELRGELPAVLAEIGVEGGRLVVDAESLRRDLNDEEFVRVTDRDGRIVVLVSRDLDERDIGDWMPAAPSEQVSLRWQSIDDERLRVLSGPVRSGGQIAGTVEIGRSTEEVGEPLGFTRGLILVAAPLVLIAATAGGVWLAGRALAPVDRIARLAAEIEAQDLSRRIEVPLPNDEIGRLARTFNAMLARIEAAFLRQRRFTADAAHELRTPLSLMQSQIEVALREPRDPEEDRAVLELLAGDIDRLTRLTNALLMLARGDTDRLELRRDRVDLAALIELIAEHYTAMSEEAGVTLTIDCEPVEVEGDEDRLIQVLVNLLDNALQHTPAGRGITVGCRAEAERARLWVADQGSGIAPEHLPHLFERFYRAGPAGGDRRGAGLGLSIVRLLVELHGGTIEISSEPDAGTTATVLLPYQPSAGPRATPE